MVLTVLYSSNMLMWFKHKVISQKHTRIRAHVLLPWLQELETGRGCRWEEEEFLSSSSVIYSFPTAFFQLAPAFSSFSLQLFCFFFLLLSLFFFHLVWARLSLSCKLSSNQVWKIDLLCDLHRRQPLPKAQTGNRRPYVYHECVPVRVCSINT